MASRHPAQAAPVHRVGRAALPVLTAVTLLTAIGCWLALTAATTAQQAGQTLALTAPALAAAIEAPFARFAQLTESVRPADFAATVDRLALTARQIRLQAAVPYASTTFLLNRTGQVVAASIPFPPIEAEVGQAKWFQHATEQPGGTLALQRVDQAWLRTGAMLVLTRNVTDESGHSAGLVGAIFRPEDIRALLRPAWMSPSLSTFLLAPDGSTTLGTEAAAAPGHATSWSDLLPRLLLAIDRQAGRPATLIATAEIPSIRATLQTTQPSEIAIRAAWSDPAAATPGLVLLAGLALCLLLLAIPAARRRGEPPGAAAPTPRTDAAAAEAALLRTQVEAIARDRDRVLAAVGHDVRTPMNSILGICALLLEEDDLADSQRVWIERIDASCEALLAMLNGMLEIASGAGNAELRPAEVDVTALVDEVAGVLAPQAHDKGLDIRTRFDDAVHGTWMVDPTRLRQVLFNLASNAIKYTASGSVELRAAAITDADGRTSMRLAVSDTGAGIAREDRGVIFERFRRGGGDAPDGREGLGLGLALCRENAALMGGSLTVDSTVGVGSEFTFEFPAERPGRDRQGAPFSGRTALVVGFDEAHARRLAGHLARLGIAVETAEDGFLAIGLAERIAARCGALDALVVNAGMSGLPAEALFTRLRSTSYGQRSAIVAIGGSGGGASVADAILPLAADGRRVATTVAAFLAAVPALECIDPTAPLPGSARVLVVEDDKVNQSLLAAALSRRGFTTFVADGGEAAVRLAASVGFDAILMDLQMPGIDGFEATRRIRAMGGRMATMPIIALTGLTGASVRKRCADERMTARVVKPVNLDLLAAELWRWIEKGRATPADDAAASGPAEAITEVSAGLLECLLSDIGAERARACVQEFVTDAAARCRRLGELLPGWEAEAIMRTCRDIGGRAAELGAVGLAEALDELAGQASDGDREGAEYTVRRIEVAMTRVGAALIASLASLSRNGGKDDREAA